MKLFREKLTDDQHINNIRKSIAHIEKYGYWLSALHLLILMSGFYMFAKFVQALANLPVQFPNNPAPNMNAWVWSGFAFGTILGIGFAKFVHNLMMCMMMPFSAMRTERLLLKYHDQVHGIEGEVSGELPDANPFQCPSTVLEPEIIWCCLSERNELRRHLEHAANQSTLSAKS